MRFISPFLRRALYPGMSNLGMFRKSSLSGNCCVVTYHGVLPRAYESKDAALDGSLVSAASLRAQLSLLKSYYHVLHPDEFRAFLRNEAELPPRSVLLTCDDGLQNVLSEMLPVLQEAGVSCLFFLTGASTNDQPSILWYEELYLAMRAASGILEIPELSLSADLRLTERRRETWWAWVQELSKYSFEVRRKAVRDVAHQTGFSKGNATARSGASGQRFLLLTREGVRDLVLAGMTVGSHTMSHPYLAKTSDVEAWSELQESRAALAAITGQEIWAMAYPFGDPFSAAVREFEFAQRAGYECAFLNYGGGFHSSPNKFAIPRVHVTADMTLGEFEAHLSGFHEMLKQRFNRQGVPPCA